MPSLMLHWLTTFVPRCRVWRKISDSLSRMNESIVTDLRTTSLVLDFKSKSWRLGMLERNT